MTERWAKISGNEDYLVSDMGRVRRAAVGARILSAVRSGARGDHSVKIHGKRYLISRLVCTAFHGSPFDGAQAAHDDGDFTNNCASNLRWATCAENNRDKLRHGTHQAGVKHPRAKLTEKTVIEIRESKEGNRSLARRLGLNESAIRKIRAGQRWQDASAVAIGDLPEPCTQTHTTKKKGE